MSEKAGKVTTELSIAYNILSYGPKKKKKSTKRTGKCDYFKPGHNKHNAINWTNYHVNHCETQEYKLSSPWEIYWNLFHHHL